MGLASVCGMRADQNWFKEAVSIETVRAEGEGLAVYPSKIKYRSFIMN
jgi:hypothetical protein